MSKVVYNLSDDDVIDSTFFNNTENGASNATTIKDAISSVANTGGEIVIRDNDGNIFVGHIDSSGITETSSGTSISGVNSKLAFFDVSTPIVRPSVTQSVSTISNVTANTIAAAHTATEVSTEFNALLSNVTDLKSDIESINTSLKSLNQALSDLGLTQ